MSITALVTGKLIADPDSRTGTNGKRYVLARLAANDGDQRTSVSVIAFGTVADQLAELAKGDTVAVTGPGQGHDLGEQRRRRGRGPEHGGRGAADAVPRAPPPAGDGRH